MANFIVMSSKMAFLRKDNIQMIICNMKTGKLMKENCSKKTSEIVGLEIIFLNENF